MIDEIALMRLVQAGQLDKLAVLFEHYKVKLYNYFLRLGNSPAQSEDLVQETFMKVLAYRSSFSGSHTFSSWLYGIARNTAADQFRKNKHMRNSDNIEDHEIEDTTTPSDHVERDHKQALFNRSLAALSNEQREIIILSRFQQLNYHDIAKLLDCNLNTLKSKMRNAIKVLHQKYTQLSGEV